MSNGWAKAGGSLHVDGHKPKCQPSTYQTDCAKTHRGLAFVDGPISSGSSSSCPSWEGALMLTASSSFVASSASDHICCSCPATTTQQVNVWKASPKGDCQVNELCEVPFVWK